MIQKDYGLIVIKAVIDDRSRLDESRGELVESFRKVMGDDCKVEFEFVDDIKPLASGKFQYTISEVAPE